MTTTLTTHRGTKFRSASKRRYLLVRDDGDGKPTIEQRSDDLAVLTARVSDWAVYGVIDQVTGELVSKPAPKPTPKKAAKAPAKKQAAKAPAAAKPDPDVIEGEAYAAWLEHGGNYAAAAATLGVHRTTVTDRSRRYMKRHGITEAPAPAEEPKKAAPKAKAKAKAPAKPAAKKATAAAKA